jgi:hypothetical protein
MKKGRLQNNNSPSPLVSLVDSQLIIDVTRDSAAIRRLGS